MLVPVILNPAPAQRYQNHRLSGRDHPNETEAQALTGMAVNTEDDAQSGKYSSRIWHCYSIKPAGRQRCLAE